MATQDKWEKQHLKSIAKYERLIKRIYDKYVQEAARIGADITSFDANNPLAFDDYPLTRKRIEALQKHMASDIEAVVYNGIDEQWALADGKTSALIATAFAGLSAEELEERKAKYLTNRDDAREAFKTRKENGMNISDRVWRYTDQFKEEMEMGIDLGLRDGKSADALSRDLRKYLNNPNMLFRRVRDEHGVLHLSKRAKAYHPGQGVYRSSYKNARRLAATETNIAYRTADHDRVQDLDFVVGIRVNLSNNHTLNGEPFTDICDELSAPFGSKATKGKGCYPKDFKFTGWHPLCRCFITTILKTPEEMDADDERIMSGDEPADPSESNNYVEDVPDNFKTWGKNNAERVERAKSVPYFIRDNRGYYNDAVNPKPKELTPLELAKQRHAQRTPEQVESIKNRWYGRQMRRIEVEKIRHEYLDTKGEHIFFDERTGGYIIANAGRYEQRLKSKQEQLKFDKEIGMCRVLATNGRRVILLDEDVRVSSPDILLNGKTAELKKLSSHNNILKEAKDAIRKKNAQFVVFEFEERTDAIWRELQKLRALNIRCIVYFADNKRKLYAI